MKILVVDDEKLIVKGLKFSLEQDGHEVLCAYDGQEAYDMIMGGNFDFVLLDVMLPKMTGYEVLKSVRASSNVPIIMLTAKSEDEDKIEGLEYGADDYITKPFNINEVKARMKAVLRRIDSYGKTQGNAAKVQTADNVIESGAVRLELDGRRIYIEGREYNLTSKEFELMALLCSNPNMIFSREKLLSIVWGDDYPGDVRTVDVHIRRLREKIEPDDKEPKYVHTKWGVGYYYKA